MYQQGDIVIVDLDPTCGHEQQGQRHCLVLNSIPCPRKVVLVAPFSRPPEPYKQFAGWLPLIAPTAENGLDEPRIVDVFQTRAVSLNRIAGKTRGKLTIDQIRLISKALALITRA